jgi:hypothetical protein
MAAIHDTEDVRRRLARLVSCNMSAYPPQSVPLAADKGPENVAWQAWLLGIGEGFARSGRVQIRWRGKGGMHRDREAP